MGKTKLGEVPEKDDHKPMADIVSILVAHYFDSVYNTLLADLDARCRKVLLSMPAYYAASMHFEPVFLHQDQEFQQQYFEARPKDDWTLAFQSSHPKRPQWRSSYNAPRTFYSL